MAINFETKGTKSLAEGMLFRGFGAIYYTYTSV
jgi:hypothetical protein